MDADLDTLATALYVKIDDALKMCPELRRPRPEIGLCPKLSDAELLTLCVIQALLGFSSETRFLGHASEHLRHLFPYVPGQSGYNKRLRRAAPQLRAVIRLLSIQTESWFDDTWLVDSTPVECGRSRETAKRSDLVGFAGYGYCASHSRYFWGLRLHLVCTPAGLPVAFALANPKDDEREVLRDLLEAEPDLLGQRPGQVIVADKGYRSAELEAFLTAHRATLIRPTMAGEAPRPGGRYLKPLRQIIESVNDTLKGQLDLERHGGRTWGGVVTRVLQRLLALTAAIWHNGQLGRHPVRSLLAYDH
ncbi:MAG: IS982 family transposase [Actinomycetota bacterium]|nr:IS982 family transposase [Actinomycetota bacterium]